jgi:hypothetical protein
LGRIVIHKCKLISSFYPTQYEHNNHDSNKWANTRKEIEDFLKTINNNNTNYKNKIVCGKNVNKKYMTFWFKYFFLLIQIRLIQRRRFGWATIMDNVKTIFKCNWVNNLKRRTYTMSVWMVNLICKPDAWFSLLNMQSGKPEELILTGWEWIIVLNDKEET